MMQPNHSQSPNRAVIYTKQSQLKPLDDTYSIQAQIDICKAYCAERGYMLSEGRIYADVQEGTVDTDRAERDQKRSFGSALEIVEDAQGEQ
jgi:DNA invertase Pin-like site-specific DNA recombinase